MNDYEFYNKNLTVNKFSIFTEIPVAMILNKLESSSAKKKLYSGNSKLLLKEYELLCNTFFGSEDIFKEKFYGKYLIQQQNKFRTKLNQHLSDLKSDFLDLLENSEILSDFMKVEKIDSLKIFPLIKNEFNLTHRSKPGDDDSTFAFYEITIGNYNIKKYLAYITEYSSKPYEVYKKFKAEENDIKNNISKFNQDFCKTLTVTKTLKLDLIDFDSYFHKVLDENKLTINSQLLKKEIENIKNEILTLPKKHNFHLIEKFENQRFFQIIKLKSFEEEYHTLF